MDQHSADDGTRTVRLAVNGQRHDVAVRADEPLVETLRDRLRLTGTKLVCGGGVCGACTVHLDGTPVNSCVVPTATVRGALRTVEHPDTASHPVARAFAALDALQCGFCTPGFVLEAIAFHDRWRAGHPDGGRPARGEIADALAGHLCRCGAYQHIVDAVTAACDGAFDADAPTPTRVEAVDKITGRAVYTADVRLDGMLHGVIVRSDVAHGRVDRVDADAVRALDGVRAVVDLLGDDRTARYVGQPIAAVAATTPAQARAAAAALSVDVTPLPAALDVDEARKGREPPVYQSWRQWRRAPSSFEGGTPPGVPGGNVRRPVAAAAWRGATAVRRINAAAARSDDRLVAGTYTTAVQVHSPLEPHGTVARWDGDRVELWTSTQAVVETAAAVARRLSLDPAHVTVHADHVGGGFGGKLDTDIDVIAAVELARAAGAPVRVVLSRAEELTAGGSRPGTRIRMAMLADERGALRAVAADSHGDGGVSIGSVAASIAVTAYGLAPRRFRDFDVVTNAPPGKPFRGPGGPPITWALEQSVDEMAHRLGRDPLDLRRDWDGNARRRALYDWVAGLDVWRDRPATGTQTGRFRRGVGLAAGGWFYVHDPDGAVTVTVRDGRLVVRTATQDPGTGLRTVLAGAVADELGLDVGLVDVEIGDSDTPPGPTSGGSRATTSIAPAAAAAAGELRTAVAPGGGAVTPRSLKEHDGVSATAGRPQDRRRPLVPATLGPGIAIGRDMSGAVEVAAVTVDTWTGRTRVDTMHAGIAAGRIYQPTLARNQVHGAVVQGIGYALYEQRVLDPHTGVTLTSNLEDYRIAGIADTPEITVHFHEAGWDHVPGGGIGIGEVATIAVAAAVGNAIHNATGWRPRDLPVRPDRLLAGVAP